MRYERIPQDGNVINLPWRSGRPLAQPDGREPALPERVTRDELAGVLDVLLVAQFELCGLDPHPTRAALSETRFRQSREALEKSIALLRGLISRHDRTVPIDHPAPPRRDDVYAAD